VVANKVRVDDSPPSGVVTVVDGVSTSSDGSKRWNELNRDDIAFISGNGRKAIEARFHVSNGTAGNFKKRVKQGDRPWQDANLLPETAVK